MVRPHDVQRAADAVAGVARETPVLPAKRLGRQLGGEIWLKLENLQVTGSFKVRGAINRLSALTEDECAAGVIAASAGNHAQAVAWAARKLGTSATLFMPAEAPLAKVAAVREYGGEVRLVDGLLEEAFAEALAEAEATGRPFIHAFDDPAVIAGQGTVALELLEQVPNIATVIVPIGGGGLISGIATALRAAVPGVRVVGVQSETVAPYAGIEPSAAPSTICDGIAVKKPGLITGPLVGELVDEIVTVSDDETAQAMVHLLERSKQVVEGAGAVGVAAVMQGRARPAEEGATVIVLSGGNVDAALLVEAIRLGETAAGRRMILATKIPDRPGGLAALLALVAQHGANVIDVEHLRDGMDLHLRETAVQLVLQTRGPEHDQQILTAVRAAGYDPSSSPEPPRGVAGSGVR
ncbi:MAG TPA: threonine ammonia-lyase [Thermoleophilaceae bacterium]|nr:threonine ammonia-lyase [Thermoleophilaceae bacterium]